MEELEAYRLYCLMRQDCLKNHFLCYERSYQQPLHFCCLILSIRFFFNAFALLFEAYLSYLETKSLKAILFFLISSAMWWNRILWQLPLLFHHLPVFWKVLQTMQAMLRPSLCHCHSISTKNYTCSGSTLEERITIK